MTLRVICVGALRSPSVTSSIWEGIWTSRGALNGRDFVSPVFITVLYKACVYIPQTRFIVSFTFGKSAVPILGFCSTNGRGATVGDVFSFC
jgi:hypothetical protein